MSKVTNLEPIVALATASGVGAIAVIRVSGEGSIGLVNSVFKGKDLAKAKGHTAHFGLIIDSDQILDEVLVTVFKGPKSFTKEDSIEISCHGSPYIIESIIKLLLTKGCRVAEPGEFTQRAFLNGQFDLVQAEAVADLIAADSAAAHKIALNQLRGGFSKKLSVLREKLIHFASLVELELDFGEEDVEFADRQDLKDLIEKLKGQIQPLLVSFDSGNVIKEGIPVAIIGPPNAGKSTLLNALFNEEKAIVTEIAGTTRDTIEDVLILDGKKFRFIDTAGIRETQDQVEKIGIERSVEALKKAKLVLFIYESKEDREILETEFADYLEDRKILWVRNKIDLANNVSETKAELKISAKNDLGIQELIAEIVKISSMAESSDTTLTNLRHYEELLNTKNVLNEVLEGLENHVTGDFLAQDIRLALYHLGSITGEISTDDLLKNIFGKFCIGK